MADTTPHTVSNPDAQAPTGAGPALLGVPPVAQKFDTARPPHTQTESTLAPTSEFVRYFLLALPARYVLRGVLGALFGEDAINQPNALSQRIRKQMQRPGEWIHKKVFPSIDKGDKYAIAYNAALGIGSLGLTASYSWMVYKDIKSIFCEAVGEEFNKPADKITYTDISRSQNKIVQVTMHNFRSRTLWRAFTDMLFFPAAWLRDTFHGDTMLGIKGVQLFSETWKRKTTMFEDLVTFINNKINPRNGLGQPISQGEIFDLYQHYAEAMHPGTMFTNVLEHGTGEGARWAEAQPIFQRIAQLMNQTYAYKHSTLLDPQTGHAMRQADFALPKFIYLMGSDLIDVTHPQKTLMVIEIANRYGIQDVKAMESMLKEGRTLADVAKRYPVPTHTAEDKGAGDEKNGVIAKGSTMQLERAEGSAVEAPMGAAHTIAPTGKIPTSMVRQPHHAAEHLPGAQVAARTHDGMLAAPTPQLSA